MHGERTGAPSCADSPEGREVVRLLTEVAERDPTMLLSDLPRRVRRCPNFSATLGNLRASVDPEEIYEALQAEREQKFVRLLAAIDKSILADDYDDY